MNDLDQEISNVFALLGLLFVFVIGYFSALLPQTEDLMQRRAPDVQAERRSLWARLRTYRKLTIGMIAMIVLVLAVLLPISRRALTGWSVDGPFPTLRAGLLLIDAFLMATMSAGVWLWKRLSRRIDDIHGLGV